MYKPSKPEGSVIILIAALLLCLIGLLDQSKRATEDAVARAFETAEVLSDFFELTQEHYTRNISNVSDVTFTTTPETTPNALMYPATFGRTYTRYFNEAHPESQFQIYSDYPFASTRGRELDDFALQALITLNTGDVDALRQVEPLEGGLQRVRFAVPIIMREGCVTCHNDISWDLARHDWEVGDVRGVREVMITVDPVSLYSQTEALLILVLLTAACGLGIFVVYPAVRSEVKSREHFHALSVRATKSAQVSLMQAHTDTLTRLGNRRYFESEFHPMVSAGTDGGDRFSLIMLDIDHFKTVNDKYGHDAGDYALKTFAETLRKITRAEDKLVRFGGEEFLIMLPNLEPSGVRAMARRIKHEVRNGQFVFGEHEFKLTVSAGCSNLLPSDSSETFLKRVDKLLYRAKNSGRNTICWCFDGDTGSET